MKKQTKVEKISNEKKKIRIKDIAQRVQLHAYLFGGFSQRICAASFKLNCTHVVYRVKVIISIIIH